MVDYVQDVGSVHPLLAPSSHPRDFPDRYADFTHELFFFFEQPFHGETAAVGVTSAFAEPRGNSDSRFGEGQDKRKRESRSVGPGFSLALLVGDGGCISVELSKMNGEFLVESLRLVLKDADGGGLTEHHRHVGVAAPVDTGVDAMTEADVVRELVEFAVYRDLIPVRASVRY